MQIADLLKKNFVIVPVVASILVGTFTGVKYIVNLTDTINTNQQQIVDLTRDIQVVKDSNTDLKQRLSRAEGTWDMAENLYRELAEKVRDQAWDIKDLNRDVNGN
jgi:chromosome segregation ATPase